MKTNEATGSAPVQNATLGHKCPTCDGCCYQECGEQGPYWSTYCKDCERHTGPFAHRPDCLCTGHTAHPMELQKRFRHMPCQVEFDVLTWKCWYCKNQIRFSINTGRVDRQVRS